MSKDAQILMFVVVGALAAVLIWNKQISGFIAPTGSDAVSGAPTDASLTNGPEYLVYNTPWAYNPALGNVLPSMTEGQIGQTNAQPQNSSYSTGCAMCGD